MKINNIVTMRSGDKRVEIHLSKDDEKHLLQYAFNELLQKGAISVVQEQNEFLLKIPPGGNA